MDPVNDINFDLLVGADSMMGEDAEETALLHDLHNSAVKYIESFKWCVSIDNMYFGCGIADKFGVFLVQITPSNESIDSLLWVVVGDIPPAYIVTDMANSAVLAAHIYVREMNKWVEAVESQNSTATLIPVNVPPTKEWAEKLKNRLRFIDDEALPWCRQVGKS